MARGKIVVDGVFFQMDMVSGIARFWREVLSHWAQSDLKDRVVLLNRGRLPDALHGFETRDCPPLDFDRWRDDDSAVQKLCDDVGAELFLSTYYTYPERTPLLLWVHDMIPELMGLDLSKPVWQQKYAAIRRATGYACSSDNTLRDLHKLFPDSRHKPSVVGWSAVSPSLRPATAAEKQAFFNRFIAPKLKGRPYIFMPGNPNGYKNGALLADALSRIDCSGLALLMTMGCDDLERFQNIPGLVVYGETLDETDLRLAYDGAHCVVYPSLYEGFGLPPIEAMACGCPVICSNTSSLPSVAGGAALMIDPRRAETLVEALHHISRPEVRHMLIGKGFKQARQFHWYAVLSELEVLMDELLGGALAPPMSQVVS